MGSVGESCVTVCNTKHLSCSSSELQSVRDWQQVWSAASSAGASCTMSWANDGRHGQGFDNSPLVCNAGKCGSDSKGTCTYDTSPRSTCDGAPAAGFSRLCPCSSSSSSPSPSPKPPSGNSQSPSPSPRPPFGNSPSPKPPYVQSSTCKADTGGTCSWMNCATSRGTSAQVQCTNKKCLCMAGYCSVNGVCKKAAELLEVEEDATAEVAVKEGAAVALDDTASVTNWYMGSVGESCVTVCNTKHLSCSSSELQSVRDWQQVWSAASSAGASCTMSWANDGRHGQGFDNSPLVCNAGKCGSDSKGTCTYDTSPRSTCDGAPAAGFSRLCPCSSSSSSPSPSPKPPSGNSQSPSPSPRPPFGNSPSPKPPYVQSSTCKADTGGTCSWMNCATSRGTSAQVQCTNKKCLCMAGYCSVNGVCKKAAELL